jgi:hypothetical protein
VNTTPTRLARLALAALAATLCASALPQTVADPTRPMSALLGDGAEARPTKGAPRPAAAASATPSAAPRLQSVQTAGPGRSKALLDGRLLHVGDRLGEQTVAAIDAQGITLSGPRGPQRLTLTNGITKTASRPTNDNDAAVAGGTPQDTP